MGAPLTDRNVYFLVAWMDMEGTSAKWNPLATTTRGSGASDFNSVGVKNYPNDAIGMVEGGFRQLEQKVVLASLTFALRGFSKG